MCHHVCRLSITTTLPIVAKRGLLCSNCCQEGLLCLQLLPNGASCAYKQGTKSQLLSREASCIYKWGTKRQDVRICARVQIVEAAQKIDLTMHLSQSGLRVFRVQTSGGTAKVSLEADLTR